MADDAHDDLDADGALRERRRALRRRTWPQRLLLALNLAVAATCFAVATGLVVGQAVSDGIGRVPLAAPVTTVGRDEAPGSGSTTSGPVTDGDESAEAPPATFPPVDPEARNYLIVGSDDGAECIDPSSPYAPGIGDRTGSGARADTIMVLRVDPSAERAAILSFPRDLWVPIAGTDRQGKINAAFVRDEPQRMVQTVYDLTGVVVDSSVQVDFCAFRELVDAVGGVSIPFETPVRDPETGLSVPEPGCFTFDPDHALAYVRSRYLERWDGERWRVDGLSDLSRISRQQDFIRRLLGAALDRGLFDPGVAAGVVDAVVEHVVIGGPLTNGDLLALAGVFGRLDPALLRTYQLASVPESRSGESVQIAVFDEETEAILDVFRGVTSLAADPGAADAGAAETPSATTATTAAPAPPDPEENPIGVVPPRDETCPA